MSRCIPIEALANLLEADLDTGRLIWRARSAELFMREADCRRWNTKYAGKPALTAINSVGYRVGAINGHQYLAHRVVWALANGEWPSDQIDHINGCRTDNRIVNLRQTDHKWNQRNRRLNSNSQSGVTGVHFRGGRWVAGIVADGKRHHLGCFSTLGEAAEARLIANQKHGFDPNHGRAA